jgi:hypothetical protein
MKALHESRRIMQFECPNLSEIFRDRVKFDDAMRRLVRLPSPPNGKKAQRKLPNAGCVG